MDTFSRNIIEELYTQLAEKIRNDLIVTLRKRGVKIRNISIDLTPENVNVKINLNKR